MASSRLVAFIHILLNISQVGACILFIRLDDLLVFALAAALVGKWRVVSFNPHRLWRNLRANSCDLIVIVSTVLLMYSYRGHLGVFTGLAIFLLAWLLLIKPAKSPALVALQGACCHFLGLTTLWLVGLERGWHGLIVLPLVGLIAYSSTRHLGVPLEADEDSRERIVIPLVWAVLMVQLAWLSWVWSITYRLPGGVLIPQFPLVGTALGYFAVSHLFTHPESRRRLHGALVAQQFLFCLLVVLAIITLTPWSTR